MATLPRLRGAVQRVTRQLRRTLGGTPATGAPQVATLRTVGDPAVPSSILLSMTTVGKYAVVPYIGVLLLMFTCQKQILYPRPTDYADPGATGGDVIEVPGDSTTGPIAVVHFPVDDPKAPTLVYFHGNGDQLGWGPAFLGPIFQRLGCAFYGVEYPGYGRSNILLPGEAAFYGTAEKAVEYLTAPLPLGLGVPPEQVVLFGQSIGGGVAMHLAAVGVGGKLVLLSPFTSVPEMAQGVFGPLTRVLPLSLLRAALADHFDNVQKAPAVTMPVCILHGDRDEIVPYEMGLALQELMPQAEFHRLPNVGHNDVFVMDNDYVPRTVAAFAKRRGPPAS